MIAAQPTRPEVRRRSLPAVLGLLGAALLVVLAPLPARASFASSVVDSLPVSTATLQAPGPVAVSTSQCGVVIFTTAALRLTWTASSSAYATGYLVTPSIAGVPQLPTVVSGGSTVTVDIPVVRGTTYTFAVRATFKNWTSTATTSAAASCNTVAG